MDSVAAKEKVFLARFVLESVSSPNYYFFQTEIEPLTYVIINFLVTNLVTFMRNFQKCYLVISLVFIIVYNSKIKVDNCIQTDN